MRAAVLIAFAALAEPDELPVREPFNCENEIVETTWDSARDPLLERIRRYAEVALKHRIVGLASYYSSFFDGRKTANGEIFRNRKYSAAHLTLPLGTWIEVTSRATGRKLRMRVNDRGPYAKKFCLDLSQAAARDLGVDTHPDRHVEIRIIALPGEEPLPDVDESTSLQVAATED
ncbi:MAG TPA: septal ring lytic transglycosylase RlpA family protein [Thermoanaerobaculia bacterium]|jgi:rare lipoprotein A|nr:septal ring lytic transglycosylase RlpA family protein [Thermoanaerobaculia bacterium]